MSDSYYPLWADQVYSVNVSLADPTDSSVTAEFTPNNIALTNSTEGSYMNISSSTINFSTSTTSMNLNATELNSTLNFSLNVFGDLDISAGRVTLNGIPAPSVSGQSLIANDAVNGGLKWFSITDLLNLEAGVYTNTGLNTSATITFADNYTTPPAVVITPDCGENGRIIPVSLAGVTTTGFSVVFGSNKLDKFNFVVLPINTSYSFNTSGANFSSSELNSSTANEAT